MEQETNNNEISILTALTSKEEVETPIIASPEAPVATIIVETPKEVVAAPKEEVKLRKPRGHAPKKHTEAFVKKELAGLLKEIKVNREIIYLGEVFEERDYPRQCYSEWATDFKDVPFISDTIRRIDDILESRVNIGGLKQKLSGPMVIFNLKNNYKWKDKTETDLSIKEIPKPILGGIKDEESK